MGDHISFGARTHALSNGAVSRLLELLLLYASRMATNDWERRFAIGFAWRLEPKRWGYSPSGFDVADIDWSADTFEAQKTFVQDVLAAAVHEPVFFDGDTASERVIDAVVELSIMIDECRTLPQKQKPWLPDEPPSHALCPTHQVYLHGRCALCG